MSTLFIASDPGEVAQLRAFEQRIATDKIIWVTHQNPLTERLLAGREIVWLPGGRDRSTLLSTARNVREIANALRRYFPTPSMCITLGDGLAISSYVAHRLTKIAKHIFIEDFRRPDHPSPAGMRLEKLGHQNLFTQHERWANSRWRSGGDAFDVYVASANSAIPVVKSLAVLPPAGDTAVFESLSARLHEIIPLNTSVDWLTDLADPSTADRVRACDSVIGQSDISAAMFSLDCDRLPVLVPMQRQERRPKDSTDTGFWMQTKGLAVAVEASEVSWSDITIAASWQVVHATASTLWNEQD